MKVLKFDRSEQFLDEQMLDAMESLITHLDERGVVSFALCAVFEDGSDTRVWNTLAGARSGFGWVAFPRCSSS